MARANKYASINFNDIYEKKNTSSSSSSTSNKTLNNTGTPSLHKTIISNSRIHGNMLVLTRPTPKPISPQTQAQSQTKSQIQQPVHPDPTRLEANSDSISLRPLGSTGGSAGVCKLPRFVSGKVEKFVPPHLRAGYVCKEEKANQDKSGNRPKSGGYDRINRASAGNRPNSTG